jgi:hypothetical protein
MGPHDDSKDGKLSLNEVIKNADKFGAKTEDFFEDQDLLSVEDHDPNADEGDEAPAGAGSKSIIDAAQNEFVQKSLAENDEVQKSLRGGN